MTTPANILRAVQTYQISGLGKLLNQCCYVSDIINNKFNNFNNIEANLGDTVTYNLPVRYRTNNSLVWSDQPSVSRVSNLTVNQQESVSTSYTAQEQIFNVNHDVEHFMRVFGDGAITSLANSVEKNVQRQNISGVAPNGGTTYDSTSGPYRFFGNGTTQINSYGQLARMIQNFKNTGMVMDGIKVVLPDIAIPSIINNGLSDFTVNRGNKDAMSWEVGEFGTPPVKYYSSNLLPIQYAGNVGEDATILTVISTNDATGQNVTQITCSGAGVSDLDAIKYGDLGTINDGTSGLPNLRALTFYAYTPSSQQVQFRVTADAGSDGSGNITFNIYPALVWAPTQDQNISGAIQAGMKISFVKSHIAGLVVAKNAFFGAFPKLPDLEPFYSSSEYDSTTGVSMQFAYGAVLGANIKRYGYNLIWGSKLEPDYCMRICFPLVIS